MRNLRVKLFRRPEEVVGGMQHRMKQSKHLMTEKTNQGENRRERVIADALGKKPRCKGGRQKKSEIQGDISLKGPTHIIFLPKALKTPFPFRIN